jgi:hypothetical protein
MNGTLTFDSAVDVADDPFGVNTSRPSFGQAFEQARQGIALSSGPMRAPPEVRRAATWQQAAARDRTNPPRQ